MATFDVTIAHHVKHASGSGKKHTFHICDSKWFGFVLRREDHHPGCRNTHMSKMTIESIVVKNSVAENVFDFFSSHC